MGRPPKKKDEDAPEKKDDKPLDRRDVLKRKIAAINKECKSNIVYVANERRAQFAARLPTGIFGLDYATNGGIPAGVVTSIWGEKSGGKTTTSQRIVANAQKFCFRCFKWKWDCACDHLLRRLGMCAYLDLEGTYDQEWGESIGVDHGELVLSSPETAEQTTDVIVELIRSQVLDLLVIDSVAYMTPIDEVEKSASEWQQGLQARLVNKMLRKLQSSLNIVYNETGYKPTILVLNQVRLKIGLVFGDPRTRIGGKGQEFAPAIDIFMSSGKYNFEDTDAGKKKEIHPETVTLNFQIMKNKTGPSRVEGDYEMAVKDFEEMVEVTENNQKVMKPTGRIFKRGEVIEDKRIFDFAYDYDLIKKESPTCWTCLGEQFSSKRDLTTAWRVDEVKWAKIRKATLDAMLGRKHEVREPAQPAGQEKGDVRA